MISNFKIINRINNFCNKILNIFPRLIDKFEDDLEFSNELSNDVKEIIEKILCEANVKRLVYQFYSDYNYLLNDQNLKLFQNNYSSLIYGKEFIFGGLFKTSKSNVTGAALFSENEIQNIEFLDIHKISEIYDEKYFQESSNLEMAFFYDEIPGK